MRIHPKLSGRRNRRMHVRIDRRADVTRVLSGGAGRFASIRSDDRQQSSLSRLFTLFVCLCYESFPYLPRHHTMEVVSK